MYKSSPKLQISFWKSKCAHLKPAFFGLYLLVNRLGNLHDIWSTDLRQNRYKSKLVCERVVTQNHGICSSWVIGSLLNQCKIQDTQDLKWKSWKIDEVIVLFFFFRILHNVKKRGENVSAITNCVKTKCITGIQRPLFCPQSIGHFRVPKTLAFKTRLSGKPFLSTWV